MTIKPSPLPLFTFNDVNARLPENGFASSHDAALRTLVAWTRAFLMRDHDELGRDGNVCPFTSMGARIDTLRYAVSDATSAEPERIRQELANGFEQFDEILHPKKMGVYRALMIAYPECDSPEGVKALAKAQRSMRLTSFLRARMIGFLHPGANEPGLWNPMFRPLRSPLPIVAIRSLVTADAAFVLRHPALAPAYLLNYPFEGPRALLARTLRRA
jgi:hypothetical protein